MSIEFDMLDFGHTKLVDFDFSILFIFKISIVAGSEICLGNFIAVLFFHDSLIQNASASVSYTHLTLPTILRV